MDSLTLDSTLASANGGPGIFSYFTHSNFAGQLIVIALLLFSLVAWTVMIGKYLELKRMKDLNSLFQKKVEDSPGVLTMPVDKHCYGPFSELVKALKGINLSVSHMENCLQRVVSKQTISYESKMIMLGSIVAGAPFLGLLGTVWGVMDAFGSMAIEQSASLQSLAPGVSGALLTTVAGLLVAIPSVFGYNFLLNKTKQMITELENFASTLADRIELEIQRR